MRVAGLFPVILLGSASIALFTPIAWAWDDHRSLMPAVLELLPRAVQNHLHDDFKVNCPTEMGLQTGKGLGFYQRIAAQLGLNPAAQISAMLPELCARGDVFTATDILLGGFVDDPDLGIDEDLPDTADLAGYRRWMGGKEGPTSKGFRHMFFGGWRIAAPIQTFQVPTHAIGLAPARAELMARKARLLLKSPEESDWGFRILAWALHYIQDLAQPFHAVQIVDLRMLNWSKLFAWPPGQAFSDLVADSTRVIGNFHAAFEHYVAQRVRDGENSVFYDCLAKPERFSNLGPSDRKMEPAELALRVADASIELSGSLGSPVLKVFGPKDLKAPGVDLFHGQGDLDYDDLAIRPDLADARRQLNPVVCAALANAALASRLLIQWTLEP